MDVFGYGKALSDLWMQGGKAMADAGNTMTKAWADGAKAAGLPPPGGAWGVPWGGSVENGPQFDNALFDNALQNFSGQWQSAMEMFGKLAAGFPAAFPAGGTGGKLDPTVESVYRRMMDPRGWLGVTGELDDMIRQMAEGPRFADLWDVERQYAGVMQAWIEVRRRSLEHSAVVIGAWVQAGRLFSQRLSEKGGSLDSKAALALWIETANSVLIETQRSDAFLTTQTVLLRASTDLRLAQRQLIEYYGNRFGFPTRTELDDVHRTVTELRREVRSLRRALSPRPAALPPPAPPAEAPPEANSHPQPATKPVPKTTKKSAAPGPRRNSRS